MVGGTIIVLNLAILCTVSSSNRPIETAKAAFTLPTKHSIMWRSNGNWILESLVFLQDTPTKMDRERTSLSEPLV
ncbi:hypothetical protein PM082_012542 [Marasmius tenuissimus]|nr:hypothetical protein PM082_012542 [Marasmius tenuissimus]